jgi:hypothetical protein
MWWAGIAQSLQQQDTDWTVGVQFPAEARDSSVLLIFQTVYEAHPIQPPKQWVPGAFSPDAKRQACETDHSITSNAEAKNGGALPPFPIPSFLPFFLSYFFLTSFLTFFLCSFLPYFLSSFLPYFLSYFLPLFLPSFLPSFLTYFPPSPRRYSSWVSFGLLSNQSPFLPILHLFRWWSVEW